SWSTGSRSRMSRTGPPSCRCRSPSEASRSHPQPPAAGHPAEAGRVATETPVALGSITAEDLASVPVAAVERLHAARRVLAIGHESPDADAFGSALGIALAVEWLGGRATPMS